MSDHQCPLGVPRKNTSAQSTGAGCGSFHSSAVLKCVISKGLEEALGRSPALTVLVLWKTLPTWEQRDWGVCHLQALSRAKLKTVSGRPWRSSG